MVVEDGVVVGMIEQHPERGDAYRQFLLEPMEISASAPKFLSENPLDDQIVLKVVRFAWSVDGEVRYKLQWMLDRPEDVERLWRLPQALTMAQKQWMLSRLEREYGPRMTRVIDERVLR